MKKNNKSEEQNIQNTCINIWENDFTPTWAKEQGLTED